ncbi:hypothetical protein K7432_010473 [Basidiobolus ranarum]|uniref:OB domain-containing protein n=1 Tax=Basidiobolus ranarum TaxID=34480 RepID=A0ABR2VVK0_9FUNG
MFKPKKMKSQKSKIVDPRIHRILFAQDLLTAKYILTEELFYTGSPKFGFDKVRFTGILVQQSDIISLSEPEKPDSDVPEKPKITKTLCFLDDATGILPVLFDNSNNSPLKRQKRLVLGDQIEVIGSLRSQDLSVYFMEQELSTESLPQGEWSRWIECNGWETQEDPIYEVLRSLELVKLYRDHYFLDKFPPSPIRKSNETGQYSLSPQSIRSIAYEAQTPVRMSQENPTDEPKASPFKIFGSSQDEDVDEFSIETIGLGDSAESEIEAFIRKANGNGVTMEHLIKEFVLFDKPRLETAVNNLSVNGIIYEMDGNYLPL